MALITPTGTPVSATSAANNLIPTYQKAAKELYNKTTPIMKWALKNKKVFRGSTYEFAVKGRPGAGWGVSTELGEFAAPAHRDLVRGTVSVRGYQHATLSITKAQMLRSKDPDAAFINDWNTESKDALWKIQSHIERQMYGSGTCDLARLASVATVTGTIDTTAYPFTTRHLREGDVIAAYQDLIQATAETGTVTIASVDSLSQFTAGTMAAWAGTSYISIDGVRTTSTFREFRGFGAICSSSSSYCGIDPTAAGKGMYRAVVDAAGGARRDLDMSYPIGVAQAIMMNTGSDGQELVGMCSPDMIGPLAALDIGSVRRTSDEGGKSGYHAPRIYFPALNGDGEVTLTFKHSHYCPPYRIYIFDPSAINVLEQIPIQYVNDKGDPLTVLPRTQIFEANLFTAMEVFTDQRNAFGMVDDLNCTLIAAGFAQ